MNEEEAIVYFKNYIKVKKEVIKERQNEWLNADSRYTQQLEEMVEVFETVLNLLEKKDRQIEQYQNMLATNDMLHVLESQKKDKQIDLMSNYICCMAYDKIIKKLKEDDIAYYGIEGSIKQYFERKVENEN